MKNRFLDLLRVQLPAFDMQTRSFLSVHILDFAHDLTEDQIMEAYELHNCVLASVVSDWLKLKYELPLCTSYQPCSWMLQDVKRTRIEVTPEPDTTERLDIRWD